MRFNKAIVRKPGRSLVNGISKSDLGIPDYALAMKQHRDYVDALQSCGLAMVVLEADERYPDSTFVEDTAVLTEDCAIVTRPGAATRLGEVAAIQQVLKEHFQIVEMIEAPGTLEGGDVLRVGSHFYVGLSERTNQSGFDQFQKILAQYGYTSSTVEVGNMLHLKTGVSYLSDNTVLVFDGLLGEGNPFRSFRCLPVGVGEDYAANCICINGTVIIAEGYPMTKRELVDAGYPIFEVDVSEFRKLDGGLSCLSLRF